MRVLPLLASAVLVTDGLIAGRAHPKRALAECAAGIFIVLRETADAALSTRHVTSIRKYGSYENGQYVWHEDASVTDEAVDQAALQENINDGVSA